MPEVYRTPDGYDQPERTSEESEQVEVEMQKRCVLAEFTDEQLFEEFLRRHETCVLVWQHNAYKRMLCMHGGNEYAIPSLVDAFQRYFQER